MDLNLESIEDTEVEVDSDWEAAISTVSSNSSSMHVCPYQGCNKFFSKKSRLDTHVLCHTGERPFKCCENNCSAAYTRLSHLKRHMDNVHKKLRFQCSKCPSHFFSKEALNRHDSHAHGNDLRFKCDICSKTFAKRNHLISHVAAHNNDLPHKCKICDKQFQFPNKLRRHMKKHDGHKCDDCNEIFDTFSAFRKHRSISHPLQFKCNQCETSFKSKINYEKHLKTHENPEEVYSCSKDNCQLKFTILSHFKRHVKLVHDKIIYKCEYSDCVSSFTSRKRLAVHMKTHKYAEIGNQEIINKKSATRKDKGQPKKAMATLLTNINVSLECEKNLLKNSVVPINASSIAKEIEKVPGLLEDFCHSYENSDKEDKTAGEICLRRFCNQDRTASNIIS